MPAVLSPAVAEITDTVIRCAPDDGLSLSPERTMGDVEALLDVQTRLRAMTVRRLRDAIRCDGPAKICGRAPKSWLMEELGLSSTDASRLLFLSRFLDAFPVTEAAFADARITDGHAAVVVHALLALPADVRDIAEAQLLESARTQPPRKVKEFANDLLEALGHEGAADRRREREYADRGFDMTETMDGVNVVKGNFTAEVSAFAREALAIAAQPCGPEDHRTPRQRFHDAMGEIFRSYLQHCDKPGVDGAPVTVVPGATSAPATTQSTTTRATTKEAAQ